MNKRQRKKAGIEATVTEFKTLFGTARHTRLSDGMHRLEMTVPRGAQPFIFFSGGAPIYLRDLESRP